jgi:hypothetical protein
MGTLARQINRLERLSGKYQVEPVSVRSGAERHGDATMVLHDGLAGQGGLLPYNPMTDEVLPLERQEETLYAVSAPVPTCTLWNLLDNKSEEQLPILTFAEWLRFIQGRSQMDQERLKMIMTRVLLRFRWLDRVAQIMFRGWFSSHEQRRALERKLEVSTKGLDAATRIASLGKLATESLSKTTKVTKMAHIFDFSLLYNSDFVN